MNVATEAGRYQRYQSSETTRCKWQLRGRAFLSQPDWLRNKLQQIKHVIRLWSPVCCSPLAPELWVWIPSRKRRREKEEKKEKECKECPISSLIVLSESKRWFVFRRQQPVKRLLKSSWSDLRFHFTGGVQSILMSRVVLCYCNWWDSDESAGTPVGCHTKHDEITLPRFPCH